MNHLNKFFALICLLTTFGINKSDAQTVIWSEDFTNGLSAGWTTVDNTGNNYDWVLNNQDLDNTTSIPYGWTNTSAIASVSGGNHMLLFGGEYNRLQFGDSVQNFIELDSYFQTPGIQLNGHDFVSVNFQQKFRHCCANTGTEYNLVASTDPTFATNVGIYSIYGGAPVNMPSGDPMDMSIDVSDIAGSQTGMLYLRWHVAAGHRYYFWMIDDIEIVGTHCNGTSNFTYTDNGAGNHSFTNTSVGSPTSYYWDFGDGQSSTSANTNHIYAGGNAYAPCLTVNYANGCSNTYCDSISQIPCYIAANFNIVDNGLGNYSFNNTSTGDVASSYWNFGDGTNSNASSPSHTFLANGTFVVELIAINPSGLCVDYQIITLQVTGVGTPTTCNAAFVIIPDSAANNDVIVYNTATGNNLTYFWNFGDGNVSTSAFPFYTYTTAGPFQLCLTINDGNGCGSTYCDSINSGGVVFKTGGFSINVQGPGSVGIETDQQAISELSIYPNPFKDEVSINLSLTENTQTEIFITDLIGNRVAQVSNKTLNAGAHNFSWEANYISNGVYLLNIKTNSSLQVKKLILNR
jgi:PKD repeat protein